MEAIIDVETKGIEQETRDLRITEQEILGQSLQQKRDRIKELEAEVRYLKELLTHLQTVPQPQTQLSRKATDVPRRWKIGS